MGERDLSAHCGTALVGLEGVDVSPARSGDHVSTFQLLQHIFHAPSVAEFHASHDAPLYEPSDRLLARINRQLLGHVHIVNRTMHFDSLRLPVAEIHHLGVLPELRGRGLGGRLLHAAETKIVEEGGELAMLRTTEPQFFARRGWIVCGRCCWSTATTRNVLARLADVPPEETSPLAPSRPRPTVRLWRQVEQDSIARLHQSNAHGSRGAFERNHEYWRWLVSRHGFERFYVAVEDDRRSAETSGAAKIVGYAAVKGARILELQIDPGSPAAAGQLLARACSDAIERGEGTLRFDAPGDHPLHQVMRQAGGRFVQSEREGGEVLMGKLFDPWGLLEQLRGDLYARAKAAGFDLPTELGLSIDGEKCLLTFTRRSAKLLPGKTGRSYLTCDRLLFCRLLLGELDVAQAENTGALGASTRVAVEMASALFPQSPIWFSPLDYQPAD